ncbi:MAG: prolipoprotein diacylglyceryl transferase [Gammaproteobacteria bacterium]|nr:prolipoprotein diacylglyceryl transferase [Gammaproteobacteria bacterium]
MYVNFDPIAISIGPVDVHWYGLMYLAGFLSGWGLGWWRAPAMGWTREEVSDLLFYAAVGVVVGGRLGYVIFYEPGTYLTDPLRIVMLQQGGMSFHGGLLGVLAAMAWYGKKTGRTFFMVTDFIAPLIPPGLFFGRIGNFINGELWGAPSNLPWAMVFKTADQQPRHPSMLYEALLEGLVLFLLLWWFARKPRPIMAVSGLFLLGYGVFRFAVEFVRVPDEGLGYLLFDWVTMGQILSTPMIVLGLLFIALAYQRQQFAPLTPPAAVLAAGPDASTERQSPQDSSVPSKKKKATRKKKKR